MERNHIPAFGSWDYSDYDLPFTQCFETVTNPEGLLHYSYCGGEEESDLYVAGDLYENDVVTPAMIVVPRRPKAKKTPHHQKVKAGKRGGGGGGDGGGGGGGDWVVCDFESYQVKEPPSPVISMSPPNDSPPSRMRVVPKAVDEDLYKISPDLLRTQFKNKKKARGWFFSSCLRPTCVC
ncbi:hypothetical protein LIER_14955 [Lithospermum erythrorhizon]|uniref:Uncharacterized protein n=1 Tax=Lithospermum erythrorhizon TaxID=34254 RepID=A0AAV3Q546_LITER